MVNLTDAKTKTNGHNVNGVVKIVGQSQLPQEFITVGKTFEEALGRCTIRDERLKNAIIIYKAQLQMFGMNDEIQHLTDLLNAASAVGGINRSLAAMSYIGIYVTEGAGIQLSKQGSKEYIAAMQRMDNQRKQDDGDNNTRK